MQQVIEMLKDGNHCIVDYFIRANAEWCEILKDIDAISIGDLSDRLTAAQQTFEDICRDQFLGETVMSWSGVAYFYSCASGFNGNGPLAYKLSQAFAKSGCSLEVKAAVEDAAKFYSVADYV